MTRQNKAKKIRIVSSILMALLLILGLFLWAQEYSDTETDLTTDTTATKHRASAKRPTLKDLSPELQEKLKLHLPASEEVYLPHSH